MPRVRIFTKIRTSIWIIFYSLYVAKICHLKDIFANVILHQLRSLYHYEQNTFIMKFTLRICYVSFHLCNILIMGNSEFTSRFYVVFSLLNYTYQWMVRLTYLYLLQYPSSYVFYIIGHTCALFTWTTTIKTL